MTTAATLARGVEELRIDLPSGAMQKMLAYVDLLVKWNKTYNLTAIREPERMVSHHLLDSLSVAPHLDAGSLADIGSGAGLPGVALAIAQPQRAVSVNDSNHKRAAFLRQAVIELDLKQVSVVHARAEDWRPEPRFHCVISRAFADLADFLSAARHLAQPGAQFAAMKGAYPHEELARLPTGFRCQEVVPLAVPFVEGARHLVLCREGA